MGKAITANLYAIEIDLARGEVARERVFPDGESECVDVETAEQRLASYQELLHMRLPVEGRAFGNIVAIHLVAVVFRGEAEIGTREVESRRKHWGWKGEPLGVAA